MVRVRPAVVSRRGFAALIAFTAGSAEDSRGAGRAITELHLLAAAVSRFRSVQRVVSRGGFAAVVVFTTWPAESWSVFRRGGLLGAAMLGFRSASRVFHTVDCRRGECSWCRLRALLGGVVSFNLVHFRGYNRAMAFLLSALGLSFAGFCVWLTIRVIDRRERWAKRVAVALLIFSPIVYVLSVGPTAWLDSRDLLPRWARDAGEHFYYPLGWVFINGPKPVRDAILWYLRFWWPE